MSWLRSRQTVPTPDSAPPARVPVDDAERRACIDHLVEMLVAERLTEEEFELRWNAALTARTRAELGSLRYDADGDEELDDR